MARLSLYGLSPVRPTQADIDKAGNAGREDDSLAYNQDELKTNSTGEEKQ